MPGKPVAIGFMIKLEFKKGFFFLKGGELENPCHRTCLAILKIPAAGLVNTREPFILKVTSYIHTLRHRE